MYKCVSLGTEGKNFASRPSGPLSFPTLINLSVEEEPKSGQSLLQVKISVRLANYDHFSFNLPRGAGPVAALW